MSSSIESLTALIVSVAAVTLSVFCALLAWRQRRWFAAMQTQLNSLSSDIVRLEAAHQGLLVREMNLPRSRRSRNGQKGASPRFGTLEESMTAPMQPVESKSVESTLYMSALKFSGLGLLVFCLLQFTQLGNIGSNPLRLVLITKKAAMPRVALGTVP